MKITQLVAKPVLTLFTLDDKDTIKEYGEAIEFWSWDRQPIDVFMKLANVTENDNATLIRVAKDLILDENGKSCLVDGNMLPTKILMKCISKIVQVLGK
jgi:hypothetical protein